MGQFCEFCGEQRSMIYCRSDAAFLCLSCDRNVHCANAISRRHSRTLVCERCNFHPAVVRCIEEMISLCQTCDSSGHTAPESRTGHKGRRSVVIQDVLLQLSYQGFGPSFQSIFQVPTPKEAHRVMKKKIKTPHDVHYCHLTIQKRLLWIPRLLILTNFEWTFGSSKWESNLNFPKSYLLSYS